MSADWVSLTKQVKEASDIVAVIGSYLSLTPAGTVHKGLCPFHSDSRPSFQVDPKWQNYRCWSCGQRGDVFTFIMEVEKLPFRDAVAFLAQRAGISMPGADAAFAQKTRCLQAMRWACDLYHRCFLDAPLAEEARYYVGERSLTGDTVRRWSLGYAPNSGEWLVNQSRSAQIDPQILVEVGLLAARSDRPGFYDRFRDRVMFPIRDTRGEVIGFGGRILPNSPLAARAPKYYNSCDTPLFNKSTVLFGLDQARQAGQEAGCLAIVEGYTDVLMAHQHGIANVIATMGTALTAQHLRLVRRYAPRVVLVYDADAGGTTGVDRALELFLREDIELTIATLPEGLDPCDLILSQGGQALRERLGQAVDAVDFKLQQILDQATEQGVEGHRRAVDAVLALLALVPDEPGSATAMKRDLVLGRLARRFSLSDAVVRSRWQEICRSTRARERTARVSETEEKNPENRSNAAPADPVERELLEILLADSSLVPRAQEKIALEQIAHPGLKRLLEGLYSLQDEGLSPDLDSLRLRLVDNPRLADFALRAQEVGRMHPNRSDWLDQVVQRMRERETARAAREVQGRLNSAENPEQALDLLRALQSQQVGTRV